MSGATSDLTIDETLLLHSVEWEALDVVVGASVSSIAAGTFSLGWNATDRASLSYSQAVASAVGRIQHECAQAHGAGVIGVKADFEVSRHHVTAVLVGTAVRPLRGDRPSQPWVSDLTTRDFCLLHNAGWSPLGLAFGTAFVQVPRRSAATALRQSTANVELANLTTAMYQAREQAMERMQSTALAVGASGVVAVHVDEGPLHFASHVISFTAWGTSIRLDAGAHRYLKPRVVVALDDTADLFQVGALGTGAAPR